MVSIQCPKCLSELYWKDGVRKTNHGEVQRFLCRECGFRFSDGSGQVSYIASSRGSACQIGANLQPRLVGNLATVEPLKDGLAGATPNRYTRAIKGKLVDFSWWMKKQNYATETLRSYISRLRTLASRGADLYNPESVKGVIARQKWSANRKQGVINAYTLFLKKEGGTWEKPKVRITRKIPFIPTEREIDNLIAGCGRKTAIFLQLLKETAMRSGEAKTLLWKDIDFEKRLIILNQPEKGSNPRLWKVSSRLIDMLRQLPKNSARTFGDGPINSLKTTFLKTRKRLARKLQNPRLTQISFHTFRHWKATMEYHRTKDPDYVRRFLGHKSLSSTEIYINVEQALFTEEDSKYHVKVAQSAKQVTTLLEAGFEYICKRDSLMFFRKRK